MAGYLEPFLTTPDHVLIVAEDAAVLTQFEATFFQVGAARDALLVKLYDPQATSRAALQAGWHQHGLDVAGLETRGRLRRCPEPSLERGVTALHQLLHEEHPSEQPIWALFTWSSVGDMEAKQAQQERLAALIATHPRLVVATGVVEPEPDAWPPLAAQWQLLGSLRGLIRVARSGLLVSRVMTLPAS